MRKLLLINRISCVSLEFLTVSIILLLCISLPRVSSGQTEGGDVVKFFHDYAGLTDDEIKSIQQGKALAKVLKSPPEEVLVFGSVFVKADPESYLVFATNLDETAKLPGYLAVHKFSDPPLLSDLADFKLDPDDIKDLQKCKPGDCNVQLPAEKMGDFKNLNWSAPDISDKVNELARQMALEALQKYIEGGNAALGTYRDKDNPNEVAETFKTLLGRSQALPVYMPDLHRYLLEYPKFTSPGIQSEFHWEKVNFGLKPTLRIVQRITYKGSDPSKPAYAVAEKQIYSSHYFRSALDITVCAKDSANADGFYLITAKGSQQAGLTGVKGGIVRNVAVDKTRSGLEKGLTMTKQKLEKSKT
jgi:hypothetical protein